TGTAPEVGRVTDRHPAHVPSDGDAGGHPPGCEETGDGSPRCGLHGTVHVGGEAPEGEGAEPAFGLHRTEGRLKRVQVVAPLAVFGVLAVRGTPVVAL